MRFAALREGSYACLLPVASWPNALSIIFCPCCVVIQVMSVIVDVVLCDLANNDKDVGSRYVVFGGDFDG